MLFHSDPDPAFYVMRILSFMLQNKFSSRVPVPHKNVFI